MKNNIKKDLKRSIERSQKAYELYCEDKLYYLAKRIYEANKSVYELVNQYLFCCNIEEVEDVINYIFHLEDWFLQFEKEKTKVKKLDEEFIFVSFDKSISFPKKFIDNLTL